MLNFEIHILGIFQTFSGVVQEFARPSRVVTDNAFKLIEEELVGFDLQNDCLGTRILEKSAEQEGALLRPPERLDDLLERLVEFVHLSKDFNLHGVLAAFSDDLCVAVLDFALRFFLAFARFAARSFSSSS
jgi:hypothetical protein